jgi:hypothetical protein
MLRSDRLASRPGDHSATIRETARRIDRSSLTSQVITRPEAGRTSKPDIALRQTPGTRGRPWQALQVLDC